jgi:hypothetical protein
VEVAAGHLDPAGGGDAANLDGVEARGGNQTLDLRAAAVVVRRVEEHCAAGLAICLVDE